MNLLKERRHHRRLLAFRIDDVLSVVLSRLGVQPVEQVIERLLLFPGNRAQPAQWKDIGDHRLQAALLDLTEPSPEELPVSRIRIDEVLCIEIDIFLLDEAGACLPRSRAQQLRTHSRLRLQQLCDLLVSGRFEILVSLRYRKELVGGRPADHLVGVRQEGFAG